MSKIRNVSVGVLVLMAVSICVAFASTNSNIPSNKVGADQARVNMTKANTDLDMPGKGADLVSCNRFAADDEAVIKIKCQEAFVAYFDNYIIQMIDRSAKLSWQHVSSVIIFVTSHIVLLLGMYFSWLQFMREPEQGNQSTSKEIALNSKEEVGEKRIASSTKATDLEESEVRKDEVLPANHLSKFKVGKDGIEFSSPVLGLIIMFISLLFFYLYLVHVYPITEVTTK